MNRHRSITGLVAVVLCALLSFARTAGAQDAPQVFAQRCASCHSIGQGRRVGPDLRGVTQRRDRAWIARMIKAPSALFDASDATATALLSEYAGVRMPDLGLNDATVSALVEHLAACDAGNCRTSGPTIARVNTARDADVARGRALFTGATPLSGGGPACMSCHRVEGLDGLGGGTLARDLTQVFARLGEDGLDAALKGTPFPLMNRIYPDHRLTDGEIFAIKSFLARTGRSAPASTQRWPFPLAGLAGLAIGLVVINAVWRDRLRGVRKPLVARRR